MNTKQKIIDGIKAANDKGYHLICGDWGNPKQSCACALGCLIAPENKNIDVKKPIPDPALKIMEVLGVSESWVSSFIEGFDGYGVNTFAKEPGAYDLGKELRGIYKPVDYEAYCQSYDLNPKDKK